MTSVVSADNQTHVQKRDGRLEPADLNKIMRAIQIHSDGIHLDAPHLRHVDPVRIATKTIGGLYDGTSTRELDMLSIQTSAALIAEEPEYSKLAARMFATYIDKEVRNQNIHSFSQSIAAGYAQGLIAEDVFVFVQNNARKLDGLVDTSRNFLFEYFGLRVLYDRYLLRHPTQRLVLETPQYFWMRVACGLCHNTDEVKEFYDLLSQLLYVTSTPTLFNSGTTHPQMSSCYLLDSPEDDLKSIYDRYGDIALLSKYAGGIGSSWSRIRATGSLIKGTNGHSNGVIPWLKTLDSSVAAVNQGGKRKGAAAIYLESWHADIEDFLELRESTGDQQRRAYNLNLANWVPDLFMERVDAGGSWSLFDPKKVPHLVDLYGDEFRVAYERAEADGLYERVVDARDLYGKMMKALAQTGNGWITFKDRANELSNQTGAEGNVIHLSNLCTEILEVTTNEETAVCNLGSINLAKFVYNGKIDYEDLWNTAFTAVKYLDRVIDINFYAIDGARQSNSKWRPVGLGVMGFQDLLYQMDLTYEDEKTRTVSARVQETIYNAALTASVELAEQFGPFEKFSESKTAQGILHFDSWGVEGSGGDMEWNALRERIIKHGLRNSLLIAIAPTATIASIAGAYECIEPQVSNLFKRETLSGEFLQINNYLVEDLKARNLWTETIRNQIKAADGSVQNIDAIPEELKRKYKTAWELSQKDIIEVAAARAPFIDQSQSLNLFVESPSIGKLSSMYMFAWKAGLKTTYYLRSRPATQIRKATLTSTTTVAGTDGLNLVSWISTQTAGDDGDINLPSVWIDDSALTDAIACSLENPEDCEACQ